MANETQWLKAKQDVTVQHALRSLGEDGQMADGTQLYEVESVALAAGDYIPLDWLVDHQQERFNNGDLDDFLEKVDGEEAEGALRELERAGRFSTFTPEHSLEREAMAAYGHDIVEREQALELASAGAQAAADAQQRAYEEAGDVAERPNLTEINSPDLAELSREGKSALPKRRGVEPIEVESVQVTPSGVMGGAVREAAETHPDTAHADEVAERQAAAKKAARKRPAANKTETEGEGS